MLLHLIFEEGNSQIEAARSLDINANMLGHWIKEHQNVVAESFLFGI